VPIDPVSADSGQESGHLLRQVLVHFGVAVEQPVPHRAEQEIDGELQVNVGGQRTARQDGAERGAGR
jgi:hypothetical protein